MLHNQVDFDTVADCAVQRRPLRQMGTVELVTGNPCFAKNYLGFSTLGESDTNKLLCDSRDSGFLSDMISEDLLTTSSHLSSTCDQQDFNMRLKNTSVMEDGGVSVDDKLVNSLNTLSFKNVRHCSPTSQNLAPRHLTLEDFVRQDEDGDTPLHLAVLQSYSEVVFWLTSILSHPYLLDIPNKKLQTALHLAVLVNQPMLVRRLVVAGSSAESRDRNGNTPLHLACREGYLDCVKAICLPVSFHEQEAAHLRHSLPVQHSLQNLEHRNYDGQMCIHLAAMHGHIDIVRLLCWAGANVNAMEAKSGRTPLHYAVERQHLDLTHFLISQCGAHIDAGNYSGYTPYQIAAATSPKLVPLLLSLGAQRRPVLQSTSSDSESDFSDGELDQWRPNKGQYLEALGEALLLARGDTE